MPHVLCMQLFHLLWSWVGDLLGRNWGPHDQLDGLSELAIISFKFKDEHTQLGTCEGRFQNCTGRCLGPGRRQGQSLLSRLASPGCSSTANPPCFPAGRKACWFVLPFNIGHLVIDGSFPKREGWHQGDAAPQGQLDEPLLLVQDQPYLEFWPNADPPLPPLPCHKLIWTNAACNLEKYIFRCESIS